MLLCKICKQHLGNPANHSRHLENCKFFRDEAMSKELTKREVYEQRASELGLKGNFANWKDETLFKKVDEAEGN